MTSGWLRLGVVVDAGQLETAEDALLSAGAVSVSVSGDDADEELFITHAGETGTWQRCRVAALFVPTVALAEVRRQLEQQVRCSGWSAEFVGEEDWVARQAEHLVDMTFGNRLRVAPRGTDTQGPLAVLQMEPGLAFGSGAHPTTQMCLDWLAADELSDKQVLDFGCGSGILALAAIRLGCARAVGVDIDVQALYAAQQNAEYNGLSMHAHWQTPEQFLEVPERFDIVVANILANPLIELAPTLAASVRTGGALLLTGVLAEQADAVSARYEACGVSVHIAQTMDDWVLLSGERHAAHA